MIRISVLISGNIFFRFRFPFGFFLQSACEPPDVQRIHRVNHSTIIDFFTARVAKNSWYSILSQTEHSETRTRKEELKPYKPQDSSAEGVCCVACPILGLL